MRRGVRMRISDTERRWLQQTHPGVSVEPDGITGTVEISATYNDQTGQFQILYEGAPDETGGLRLVGCFSILLQERTNTATSRLPALFVRDLDPIPDRHFGQLDFSACLCSPFRENEFLDGGLDLIRFFEQLVIPFLYGQLFFSREGRWPWAEYAHGVVGLLEAYLQENDPSKAARCLELLVTDLSAWVRIQPLLRQRGKIKGNVSCFCGETGPIGNCHPKALTGMRRLQRDLRFAGVARGARRA
jgi:hypothetical protein